MTDPEQTGGILRWVAGALVPMFVRPNRPVAVAWLLHLLLVAALVVGAFFLQNNFTKLYAWVDKAPDWFRPFWLPALLLLVYALLWAAAWLWAQLAPEQASVVYPDLDDAWATALESLQRAGIGIGDTPVFLVVGELPNGFEPLFRALPRGVAVAGGTPSESAVRVFANADAIYVTLSGATLLGVQEAGDIVDLTTGGGGYGSGMASVGVGQSVGYGTASIGAGYGDSVSAGGGSLGASLGASMAGGGGLRKIQRIIQKAKTEGRELTDAEKAEIRQLSAGGGEESPRPKATAKTKGPPISVLQNPELVGEAEARLTYICKKIAGSRWPLCPVNGLILAVPVSALESETRAVQWGSVARQDLAVIEHTLKLRFPVFGLVGGMELLPGGGGFFDVFGAEKGNQRLGKGFPLNPDGGPEQAARGIEANASWVLGGLMPYWALKYTRVSGGPTDTDDNAGAVRFLTESSRRGPALGKLLSQAVASGEHTPTFGGCYLVVGSVKDPTEAKFARDFFKKVEGSQAAVAWTDEAYATDAGYRRWTLAGYVALAVILVGVLGLAAFVFSTKKF
jgi:hypothetical protein